MRGKRERLYDVSFGSVGDESRIVFRAWTPVEAAAGAEEALHRAGVRIGGELVVRDTRGRVVLRVRPHAQGSAGVSGAA